ncbi:hypothetical protein RFI_25407, partial [Reticulomyxa filosa]
TSLEREQRWNYFAISEHVTSANKPSANPTQQCKVILSCWLQISHPCLDDYDLIALIGEGKFAPIFQVRKKIDKGIYVVKVYSKCRMIEEKQVEHSIAENVMLKRIRCDRPLEFLSRHFQLLHAQHNTDHQRQVQSTNPCPIANPVYWENLQHFLNNSIAPNPFITVLRECFDEYNLYFVMDYYSGGDLFHYLSSQNRLSENIAKLFFFKKKKKKEKT